ncbi:MAG: endonuclease domain-containing protein [Candidatus Tritonobacter lacicola]|nr:endonuclease domain-containing protein [Candidatus Tritonobacter lacicola]
MKKRARQLRERQTATEARLWYHLRNRRMKGNKFRRQHPIGKYVVDFYCPNACLAIELDGGGHAEEKQKIYDDEREKILASYGVKVVRFWDNEVWQELESVLQRIWDILPENPSP